MTKSLVKFAVCSCVLVAVVVGLQMEQEPVVLRPLPPAGDNGGAYDRIQLSMNAANTKGDQALQLCRREIDSILQREFAEAERKGSAAAEEMAGYGSCCHIIYLLAKDKIRGTSAAPEYVGQELGSRLRPSLETCSADLNAALERFDSALKKNTVTLAAELAQMNPAAGDRPIEVSTHVRTNGDLDNALRNLGFQSAGIGVSFVFDFWAILNTGLGNGLISKAATAAAGIFARPAAAAAAEVSLAAADGPLPIGDFIAVIGGVWTAYDIYSSRQEFERELRTALANALPELKRSVHGQVEDHLRSILTDYQRLQDDIRNTSVRNFAH